MSTESNNISQKPASPDELNKLLRITTPYHWVGISAIVALMLFGVLWSIFGSIPQRLAGIGEITTKQGLSGVFVRYQGQVEDIYFGLGDTVHEGQVVARLSQPQVIEELAQLYTQRDILKRQSNHLITNNSSNARINLQAVEAKRKRLNKNMEELNKKTEFLKKRLKEQDQLYKDGLITYSQYFQTQDQLSQVTTDRNQLNEELLSVQLSNEEWKLQNTMKEEDLTGQVSVVEKKIEELQKEHKLQTDVRATVTGVISDVDVSLGDVVAAGKNMFTIEQFYNEGYRKLNLFIPFNEKARVLPGMEVQVEPFTVDHNIYGWLKGEVTAVQQYVSSQQSIENQMNDPDLVSLITKNGPVYSIEVKLQQDRRTVSGYAFSNRKGPPFKIQTGALCNAYVEVKKKAPIDYLIPIFKEYFE